MVVLRAAAAILTLALLLTILFWGPLWYGYGFVGGDLYPYFFPQKTFLADRLHAGEFPLWNNLTGFGYPVLGESQTGAAYPPHLLAYSLLDVNTAYNVEHLLHYVLCFAGTWLLGRRLGLGWCGAVLTAIVFTYGWFPPRACLEWAIVTGAWLPLALWCVESFVQTRHWRYAIGLSVVLGLQLLAGHFHLAFITELLVVAYGVWRVRSGLSDGERLLGGSRPHRLGLFIALMLAVAAGFLLAAVQLAPAWELKTRSSRATVGGEHEPSYGHLPPLYVSQLVAPWLWYSPHAIVDESEAVRTVAELAAPWHWFGPRADLDELLMKSRAGGLTSIATNKVEAHLYCGLVPLALAVWWLVRALRRPGDVAVAKTRVAAKSSHESSGPAASGRENRAGTEALNSPVPLRGEAWFWLIAGVLAVVYATGWLLPVARWLPGFNFFRGPGRYGIVTTLAVAILAGRGLGNLVERRTGIGRSVLTAVVLWSSLGDLWLVSRMVWYAQMVPHPPISYRDHSPLRKLLLAETTAPRLYAPGQNLGNLLGVSCLPVYLGIAPAEYSDRKFAGLGMPRREGNRPVVADAEFSKWLRDCGVTHILSEGPLDEESWRAEPVWTGIDPLWNSAWGRASDPLYLYRLRDSAGRASLVTDDRSNATGQATAAAQRTANRFVVETRADQDATLLVRELNYPGWQVEIDGQASAMGKRGLFRELPVPGGTHQVVWRYSPFSVRLGLIVTLVTVLLLAAIGHLRFWHGAWVDRIVSRMICRRNPG